MKPMQIRNMPEALHTQLKVLAAQTGKSMNEVILEAINLVVKEATKWPQQ